MRRTKGTSFDGRRAVVSGSGNVAIYAIEKIHEFGDKVVACSDSSGFVVDDNGIDLDLLKETKLVRRERISAYAEAKGRSEEHTSELQSLMRISYAVFCLKKKKIKTTNIATEKN